MRPRFSLRMLFVVTTLVAGVCYWLVRPSLTAQQFADAVAAENYELADRFFRDPKDRFIAAWATKYWGFQSHADLQPLTLRQLLSGRRDVGIQFTYFHLDQNSTGSANIVATSFGLKQPIISHADSPILIERNTKMAPKK